MRSTSILLGVITGLAAMLALCGCSGTQQARTQKSSTKGLAKGGFVSWLTPEPKEIDMRGFPPGMEIKDPYTGELFIVGRDGKAIRQK